jgi:hypothetical protein
MLCVNQVIFTYTGELCDAAIVDRTVSLPVTTSFLPKAMARHCE